MDAVETVVNYGILSLVPPVLAIALALITKNIIVCDGVCERDDCGRF